RTGRGEWVGWEPIGVVGLVRPEDRAAVVHVADDVRVGAPAVLRLHVEEDPAVADVGVPTGDHPRLMGARLRLAARNLRPRGCADCAGQSSALPATCRRTTT